MKEETKSIYLAIVLSLAVIFVIDALFPKKEAPQQRGSFRQADVIRNL